MAYLVRPDLTDKQRGRCTYCYREIGVWSQSQTLYKHSERPGVVCRASGTKAWTRIALKTR